MKAFALTLAMALGMLLPTTMNAQSGGSDNWFRGGSDNYENRDGVAAEIGITNQQMEQAPIGSGLLIMVFAGAGYALIKKKED